MIFFSLPPELRNVIYDLALPIGERFGHWYPPSPQHPTRRSPRELPQSTAPPIRRRLNRHEKPGLLPNLLLVSKQIRAEAAPMFYANNSIEINAKFTPGRFDTLPQRLRAGENVHIRPFNLIKKMTVRFETTALRQKIDCTCRARPKFLVVVSTENHNVEILPTAIQSLRCTHDHWKEELRAQAVTAMDAAEYLVRYGHGRIRLSGELGFTEFQYTALD